MQNPRPAAPTPARGDRLTDGVGGISRAQRELYRPPYENTMHNAAFIMDITADFGKEVLGPQAKRAADGAAAAVQSAADRAGAAWRLPFVRLPLTACWVLKYVGMYYLFEALRAEEQMDEQLESLGERERGEAAAARRAAEEKERALERDEYDAMVRARNMEKTESLFRDLTAGRGEDEERRARKARNGAMMVDLFGRKEAEGWDDEEFVTAMASMPSFAGAGADEDADGGGDDEGDDDDGEGAALDGLLDEEIRRDGRRTAGGGRDGGDDGRGKNPWTGSFVDFL